MATMMGSAALAERYILDHPGTTMTRNAIRVMLKSGCVPVVNAGNRKFYGYESFIAFLDRGNGQSDEQPSDHFGEIRRIS